MMVQLENHKVDFLICLFQGYFRSNKWMSLITTGLDTSFPSILPLLYQNDIIYNDVCGT